MSPLPKFQILTALLLAIPLTHASADDLQLILVTPATIADRLQQGKVPQDQREDKLEQLFREVGCEANLQRVDKRFFNVICYLPGDGPTTIVVGAHSDFIEKGQGIVDDWSGTSLLVSLYETLKQTHRQHSFAFVAFTREEVGLIGSAAYVKTFVSKQDPKPEAFINLECLGLDDTKVWASRADPELLQRLLETSKALKLPLQGVNVDSIGDDDSHPFLSKKVPVITLHSVTARTLPILHSSRDKLEAINPEAYYSSYKLIAFYLKYLDSKLPIPPKS